MAGMKAKIKHFLHTDKPAAEQTTPDAAPGYANLDASTFPTTTTNVPEAFYPGSLPVAPNETHSTSPYSSALGQQQIATPPALSKPSNVPSNPEAMLGAPPSGKPRELEDSSPSPDEGGEPIDEGTDSPTTEGEGQKSQEELEAPAGKESTDAPTTEGEGEESQEELEAPAGKESTDAPTTEGEGEESQEELKAPAGPDESKDAASAEGEGEKSKSWFGLATS